jgi:hypothetical protein
MTVRVESVPTGYPWLLDASIPLTRSTLRVALPLPGGERVGVRGAVSVI